MEATENVEAGAVHVCETCFKSYQRRDLLMRHRRRCQRPKNPVTRRKACDACAQAKAKCDYKQPTCSRCAKRDMTCQYVTPTDLHRDALDDANRQASLETGRTGAAEIDYSYVSSGSLPRSSAESSEISSPWRLQMSPWSLPFDDIDTALQGSAYADMSSFAVVDGVFGIADRNDPTRASVSQQSTPSPTDTRLPNVDSLVSPSATMPGLTSHTSIASLGGLDINPAPLITPNVSPYNPRTSVNVLGQYPSLLLSDEFSSPFIHRFMYNEQVPDMTTLPRTSMAICCGSGIHSNNSTRYIKRAICAERQSLIEKFPTYQCMEQWDALHAMLVYELLEFREAHKDLSDGSRQNPRVKGLQLPFIVKMAQCFSKSYPEIRNPDQRVFLDGRPGKSLGESPWHKWMITETARRTVFLAHIVNFFCNRDLESGKQSPYYEPLDDDLIMNIPLPCSHALWSARTEDEWTRLIKQQHEPSVLASDSMFRLNPPLPESPSLESLQPSIKHILSKVTKDYLRTNACKGVGFSDSEELRRLLIVCVLEQFD